MNSVSFSVLSSSQMPRTAASAGDSKKEQQLWHDILSKAHAMQPDGWQAGDAPPQQDELPSSAKTIAPREGAPPFAEAPGDATALMPAAPHSGPSPPWLTALRTSLPEIGKVSAVVDQPSSLLKPLSEGATALDRTGKTTGPAASPSSASTAPETQIGREQLVSIHWEMDQEGMHKLYLQSDQLDHQSALSLAAHLAKARSLTPHLEAVYLNGKTVIDISRDSSSRIVFSA